jgi:hypothetical protein
MGADTGLSQYGPFRFEPLAAGEGITAARHRQGGGGSDVGRGTAVLAGRGVEDPARRRRLGLVPPDSLRTPPPPAPPEVLTPARIPGRGRPGRRTGAG